ncbi:hypothetical protein ASZ90_005767 [hydrocarbon metagenome]|uniref:Uncharacterized protein n=1 Tax=hydrocarbon metagenome TaxID=938273 RepID=A0A0W8FU26_9ZZZZ
MKLIIYFTFLQIGLVKYDNVIKLAAARNILDKQKLPSYIHYYEKVTGATTL